MFSLCTHNKIEADCVGHTFMWTKCALKTIKNIKRMLIHNRASGSRLDQKTLHKRSFSTNEALREVIHTLTFYNISGNSTKYVNLTHLWSCFGDQQLSFQKRHEKPCHYFKNVKKHLIVVRCVFWIVGINNLVFK